MPIKEDSLRYLIEEYSSQKEIFQNSLHVLTAFVAACSVYWAYAFPHCSYLLKYTVHGMAWYGMVWQGINMPTNDCKGEASQ